MEPSRPRGVCRLDECCRAEDHLVYKYSVNTSLKGVLLRYKVCSVTASLRASSTLALRGPVRLGKAYTQLRGREPLLVWKRIAFAAPTKNSVFCGEHLVNIEKAEAPALVP